ncbi:MAG TPA: bifunctional diaminohydroxyphosphoribosylaminopyrimidine deaminase/5-amino-6-(5-phosphoribosylamino)uracil reductase RibD, partial [Thermoanaerobaculia bacterium]|nr:bifunctional diaminohydroxyphosphoribosylaminopyrimidine deaminase/5-amino-6-(5-phosphoribosylamino)uracil reductase RibD [Thermoanaerobaculia bacterium]
TSPNPMVGAVVVRRGRVVGEGYHHRAGGVHAEILALRRAGPRARGADLYVSLEPCNHAGRTPPCTRAILDAGIARVIAALPDPNPRVAGGGGAALSRSGVVVLRPGRGRAEAAARQNERFLTWAILGRPFVLAKWASSLDGKIADSDGRSRWITGEAARRRALLWREEHDAVLVGAGTVAADDPLLTRRLGLHRGRQWRVVLDGRLRLSESARLLDEPEGVLIVTSRSADHPKVRRLAARGVEVWSLPGDSRGRFSVRELLRRLAKRDVTGLMVEGGADTLWQFLQAGVVDRVAAFLSPQVLGGLAAPGSVAGEGFRLGKGVRIVGVRAERIGEDLLVTGRVAGHERSMVPHRRRR